MGALMRASGFLRVDGRWAYLDCGMGWYHYCLPELERRLWADGRWVMVRDEARRGSHDRGPISPRLAYVPDGVVQPPTWGPHISIVRGENLTRPSQQMLAHAAAGWGKSFDFAITDPEIHKSPMSGHFFLRVKVPQLEELRVSLGLRPQPPVPWHLTIAVKQG